MEISSGSGAGAVPGGLTLVVGPDGARLQAKLSALAATPFADWRVPGLLCAARRQWLAAAGGRALAADARRACDGVAGGDGRDRV